MGQPVTVIAAASARPGVWRYQINRSLTGMGHERYLAGDDVSGDRPPDVLARRLFETGEVDGVHINSNVITVDLRKGGDPDRLIEVMEGLFTHYVPGVLPPTDEELMGEAPAS